MEETMRSTATLTATLLCLLLYACSGRAQAENVLTGYGLDETAHSPEILSSKFDAGEPFSIVLKPALLRDSFVELIVYSYDKNRKRHRVRNITLSGIDTNENFIQINNAFLIPFPGRYRISFEQLNNVLGWAEVEIVAATEPE